MEKVEFTRFIERYLEDKMQPSEKRWFEKELDGNIWLRKELELRKKADEIASNFDATLLRQKLMDAEIRHRNTKPVERIVKKVPANYAATFVGLILVSSLLFFSSSNFDISSYADSAVDSYMVSQNSRSFSNAIAQDMNTGIEMYNSGNYTEAISHFNKVPIESVDGAEAVYLSGMAMMQNKDYHGATRSFKAVIDHSDNVFLNEAMYYSGLCYYNIGEAEKAKLIMEGIIQTNSRYKKEAKKLTRKIK